MNNKTGAYGNEKIILRIGYFDRGFLTIQRAIDTSIIAELGGKVSAMKTFLKKFAFPGYLNDAFIKILQTQLSTSTMFGFFYICSVVCSEIVSEKQNKIKAGLFKFTFL